jgi:hypothetical protein
VLESCSAYSPGALGCLDGLVEGSKENKSEVLALVQVGEDKATYNISMFSVTITKYWKLDTL